MITNELLDRFFVGELSEQENADLSAWMEADPAHRAQFNRQLDFFLATKALAAGTAKHEYAEARDMETAPRRQRGSWWLAMAGSVAAAVALTWGITWTVLTTRPEMQRTATVITENGQRATHILPDGTVIRLNSGSILRYPATFKGKERRVYLEGEALFEVAKDKKHPFIAETYAYDVKALGTQFNLAADPAEKTFSTALLEGSVAVLDKRNTVQTLLEPGQLVSLGRGGLTKETREHIDETAAWTKGILTLGNLSFEAVLRNLEKYFGARIVIERNDIPVNRVTRMKVYISDGVEVALKLLQEGSDFCYTYDPATNTYHIR